MATVDKAHIKIRSTKIEIRPDRLINENDELKFELVGSLDETKTRPNHDGTVNITWVIKPITIEEV